ncbi:FCGBP-like protein [Mya arenaria]|uniref:FCGBP-like protein n=1 Tax=Mya arenaria TaxID=6604 RepID=A0ABY7E8Y4_MYAAR|nr:FCGBP-like protein [Mya arenaria]
MFMENLRLGTQVFNLELYCTTQEKTPVSVHVTSPLWSSPKVDTTFSVVEGQVQKVIIASDLRMTGSGVDNKAILVTANKEVACYGANKETLSNDGYLGLPVDALGTDYYAIVHSPPTIKAEVGLASTEDGTNVKITLPSGNGPTDVTFQGKTYHAGDTISVNLNKFQTLQIQSDGDLTGTHIEASHPVAAFSGNIKTNIGKGSFSDHLVEQLVPSDRWGKEFVTAPIPGRTVGDVFRVVAKEDNTVVTVPGKSPIHLNAGERAVFEIPSTQYSHITSSKPIMMAQFVKSQQNSTEPADPSMMIIPPYEQFGSDYTFTMPEYSHPEYGNNSIYRYQNEFMIVAKKSDISGLLLDGKPFPQTQWVDIPGSNLVGSYVTLPHGPHTVRHSDPLSTFGGYLYGHAYHESYGFPTGMRTAIIYNPNCKPTPSVPGDGIDNDCDNKIDEELCTLDNKRKVDGQWGNWGTWSSSCSVTCGDGVLTRVRLCDAPKPKFGGINCTGNDQETKSCYSGQPCPLDVNSFCSKNSRGIAPNPVNCAQYIDCSRTSPLGQPHLFECPYPDLFNNVTMQCDDFEHVQCGRRMEPMDPCDYIQNKCNGSDPNCPPCRDRWPTCVGVDDGKQPQSSTRIARKTAPWARESALSASLTPSCISTLGFYCRQHPTELLAEPSSCAKYYDCSKKGHTLNDFVAECTYPDLFSTTTGKCGNFTSASTTKTNVQRVTLLAYVQTTMLTAEVSQTVSSHGRVNSGGLCMWSVTPTGPLVNTTEIKDVCTANPKMVYPDSQNCQKYINCSAQNTLLGNHIVECTYPDLFSMTTKACEQFDTVNCDKRHEPMAPCDYDQNKCSPGNSTCNCPNLLPSCVSKADGNQSFPSHMWKPDYITCNKNRTVIPTKKCTKGPYCQANPSAIFPWPDSCAQYVNCSALVAGGASSDPVSECKYPDLFSTTTMKCQDFATVQCGLRPEPQAPLCQTPIVSLVLVDSPVVSARQMGTSLFPPGCGNQTM